MAKIQVIDKMTGQVLPGANCVYLDANRNVIYVPDIMTQYPVVGFDTAGNDGLANVPSSAGGKAIKYVKVTFIGFTEQIVENVSGAVVRMTTNPVLLDEITVTACKKYHAKNATTGNCEFSYLNYAKENQFSMVVVMLIIYLIVFLLIHKF